uniref:protein-serine/threonine phosphatase n=1 Tax=Timema genevievae TaxID=629358 RepID=A0A7R9K5C1_TIMGE|nr:unnamed protein product [Timema genevievae]
MTGRSRSALQTLHKVSSKAREHNFFLGGLTHDWVSYYERRIESDRSCLNEWHTMDSLESRRPPSPDSVRTRPCEREETEKVIRATLKEIMMSVDLDEVTSKYIRGRLEEDLDMDLVEFKPFIDQEMLTILGQMDAATEVFDHVYLGSEWNASNLEELHKNGNQGSKVLVHCKMGVSRSASVVIAYAMKAYNWDLKRALSYVKDKRSCIKPNTNFVTQLETYQGMLAAMKNREKLQRSKSETNLPSTPRGMGPTQQRGSSAPAPELLGVDWTQSGQDLARAGCRPKSWSPDNDSSVTLFNSPQGPMSVSLEQLNLAVKDTVTCAVEARNYNLNVRMPCGNGQAYSVSQNKVVHLPNGQVSVKHRVNELESLGRGDRRGLVLHLTPSQQPSGDCPTGAGEGKPQREAVVQTKLAPQMLKAILVKKEIWDPGEGCVVWSPQPEEITYVSEVHLNTVESAPSEIVPRGKLQGKIGRTLARRDGDPFSAQLDRVFEREERKQQRPALAPILTELVVEGPLRDVPSRQSSWGSYDSAVVLNDGPSRQSSWGSGDARWGTLPSRNSSWGSYDMRPGMQCVTERGERRDDGSGTIKRTKQKLEEGASGVKRVCPNSQTSEELVHYASSPTLGSVESGPDMMPSGCCSQPNISAICSATNNNVRCVLNNLTNKSVGDIQGAPQGDTERTTTGLVQNLKKEFEAKLCSAADKSIVSLSEGCASESVVGGKVMKVRSLPSSPVSVHPECRSPSSLEDLSVRTLVGRYEVTGRHRYSSENEGTTTLPRRGPPHYARKSSLLEAPALRLPSIPRPVVRGPCASMVVASVVAASKKLQQGKTHPLARLTIHKPSSCQVQD